MDFTRSIDGWVRSALNFKYCVEFRSDILSLLSIFYGGSSGVRMSSGHLCEAEAPTEPTGETADPYDNVITDT